MWSVALAASLRIIRKQLLRRKPLSFMTPLLLIPLDDTVVFPTMDVTLPVDADAATAAP